MYRQREIDQTRRGIVDSSNNPNVGTDIVRANCWTDTLRDILESYATQTTTSTMRMRRQAIQAMLVSGYFENLAQTLFDVIKRKSVLLVSSRQLSDITMLAELFEDIEGHFLERYRLTADKWNQPRHRELRAHMAEIRGIVTTFSLERRVSSDVEGLCSQGNPIAVLESDMARRAFIAAI